MDDELRERGVERVVGKRQLLGRPLADVDLGCRARAAATNDSEGSIAATDFGAEPLDELRRQRARPAADVEHPLTGDDVGQVGELRRQMNRVAAHEAVVRVSGYGEAHGGNLRGQPGSFDSIASSRRSSATIVARVSVSASTIARVLLLLGHG